MLLHCCVQIMLLINQEAPLLPVLDDYHLNLHLHQLLLNRHLRPPHLHPLQLRLLHLRIEPPREEINLNLLHFVYLP